MTTLVVTLLGAPRIERDGYPVELTTRKAVALLAYLALTGVPHTRDALITLFWPESDTTHARGALRFTLARLKAALGEEWLAITREQIGLAEHTGLMVDVLKAKSLLAQVRAHGHDLHQLCPTCLAALQALVTLYGEPLLAGFGLPDAPDFDDWLLFEAKQIEQARAETFARLIAALRAVSNLRAAIPIAQRWLALDPLDEQVNQMLIDLYRANNQYAAARRHYSEFAKLFHAEFGVAPAIKLDDSPPRALANTPALAPASAGVAAPPLSPAPPTWNPSNSLPKAQTPLLGRAHDLQAIGQLLDDGHCRLLTLIGPGGSGKTRLAMAVAQSRRALYRHGVVFVPLAGLTTPVMVEGTIAAAVGCQPDGQHEIWQSLREHLQNREMLLVLDNVEHLLERTRAVPGDLAALIAAILTHAPGVQLLVTSRVRTQLYEEQLYPVHGLEVPTAEARQDIGHFGAIQLFVQSARRVLPNFAVTPANSASLVQVVRLLAGQPLAIELAAAWVTTLAPGEILAELAAGIDLLATTAHNVAERHRSLRATYHISWERLLPAEQALHQELSVFRGGFSRGAATYVTGATPRLLQALIDQSLLIHNAPAQEKMAYEMHELLRQFAAEQLARDPAVEAQVRARHAAYYLGDVAELGHDLSGPQQRTYFATVRAKLENIRVAWVWAVGQRRLDLLGEAMGGLGELYHRHGRVEEGIAACDAVINHLLQTPLADSPPTAPLLGHAFAWKAAFAIGRGQLKDAAELLARSQPLLENAPARSRAFAHYWLGQLGFLTSDLPAAQQWLESSLALYEAAHFQVGAAATLERLGRTAWLAGDAGLARSWYLRALAIHEARHDQVEIARTLADLALVTLSSGQSAEGLARVAACAQIMANLDDPWEVARVRRQLGMALLYTGFYAEAQSEYEACVVIDELFGNQHLDVHDHLMLALAHLSQRNLAQVQVIGAATFDKAQRLGLKRDAGFALMLMGFAELAEWGYQRASDLFEKCLYGYQLTTLADDQSMTWMGLSVARRGLHDLSGAREAALRALTLAAQGRGIRASLFALIAYANVLLDEGDVLRAIEIEAMLLPAPRQRDPGLFYDFILQPIADAVAHLPPTVVEAARARGRNRKRAATVAELLQNGAHAVGTPPQTG